MWLLEERLRDGFVGQGVFIPCFATVCSRGKLADDAFPTVFQCPAERKGGSCESPSWEPTCGSMALPCELIKQINLGDARFRWGSCRRIYKVVKNILMESTNHL